MGEPMCGHFTWDYEETEIPHFQITPISAEGEAILGGGTVLIYCQENELNRARVQEVAWALTSLAAHLK